MIITVYNITYKYIYHANTENVTNNKYNKSDGPICGPTIPFAELSAMHY